MSDVLTNLLRLSNETLTIAIAITAASMLLYNLVRNLRDRVTRASGIVLGCITIAFVTDSLASMDSDASLTEVWFRLEWVGIAFIPAALFHLADALLATTGLVSRGRRRAVVRVLYTFSTLLALIAAFDDSLVYDLEPDPVYHMLPGPLFGLYTAYFVVACIVSTHVVWRARKRCLTTSTRRRMSYLLSVFLMPALGTYPYSMLFEAFGNGQALPLLPLLAIFNVANLLIVGTLVFMAYPLSFFGNNKPDRVIKAELLHFLLRGPFTASLLIGLMLAMPGLSRSVGVMDNSLLVMGVTAALLGTQWLLTLALPSLEKWLIYTQDQAEAHQLRLLSDRLLTRNDISQLEETILAALCDQLRSPSAFIVIFDEEGVSIEQSVGDVPQREEVFQAISNDLSSLSNGNGQLPGTLRQLGEVFTWQHFWLFPLRQEDELLGVLGIWTLRDLTRLDSDQQEVLQALLQRATHLLADRLLQAQVFEQINRYVANVNPTLVMQGVSRYGQIQQPLLVDVEEVRSALRDFWGGPRLSESDLLRLSVVQKEMDNHDGNPIRALQSVLSRAIETLRPADEKNRSTPEWILYNILEMRYMQGRKVRDVARHLFMSEPDFYRKQRIAIEEVARSISEMERSQLQDSPPNENSLPTP